MKMVVCGGRDYEPTSEDRKVFVSLLHYFNPELVIHGGARGVDVWAGKIAVDLGYDVEVHRPDYKTYPNNSAPPIRNTKMASRARGGVCVAFTGGTGTAHMLSEAQRHNMRPVDLRK